nr:ferritin family protein [uncultured Desulfobacter sp.]
MAYDYNAAEAFEMAIQIEKNGAAFYRKAASLQKNEDDKKFLETIAKMEDRHQGGFEEMQTTLSEMEKGQTVFDPNEEMSLYLKAMADAHGGEGNPEVTAQLTGEESITQIVKMAIEMEKESILFYAGLKNLVPPKLGREKIDEIIQEEQKHVVQLTGFLNKAQG